MRKITPSWQRQSREFTPPGVDSNSLLSFWVQYKNFRKIGDSPACLLPFWHIVGVWLTNIWWMKHPKIYQTLQVMQHFVRKCFESQLDSLTKNQVGPLRGSQREHSWTLIPLSPTEDDFGDLLIFYKCTNLRDSAYALPALLSPPDFTASCMQSWCGDWSLLTKHPLPEVLYYKHLTEVLQATPVSHWMWEKVFKCAAVC